MHGLRRWTCPFCGLRVLGDDATWTIHHEAPVCERFGDKLLDLGLSKVRVEPTAFFDDEGSK